jgi:hypothetical protein
MLGLNLLANSVDVTSMCMETLELDWGFKTQEDSDRFLGTLNLKGCLNPRESFHITNQSLTQEGPGDGGEVLRLGQFTKTFTYI